MEEIADERPAEERLAVARRNTAAFGVRQSHKTGNQLPELDAIGAGLGELATAQNVKLLARKGGTRALSFFAISEAIWPLQRLVGRMRPGKNRNKGARRCQG